jgi:hypothetical protein
VLALALTLLVPPPTASAAKGCSVKNTTTARTYATLQGAVDAAQPRAKLLVRGTCRGATVIRKHLAIDGVKTKRWGRPILDGRGRARPLTIRGPAFSWVQVAVRNLTVRNGRATRFLYFGYGGNVEGGIAAINAKLRLRDVTVRANHGRSAGGGIYTAWSHVWLNGDTRVVLNRANRAYGQGGGIYGHINSLITLNGSSRIGGNRAGEGGGVQLIEASLRLNGRSTISGNVARGQGGGVYSSDGGVHLNDSSAIRDNRAGVAGGGVYDDGGDGEEYWGSLIALHGASSISGNRALAADSCCGKGCGGPMSRAGGVRIGEFSTLRMTEGSTITANLAACGAGGLEAVQAELVGVTCAPVTLANVYANTPKDCSVE